MICNVPTTSTCASAQVHYDLVEKKQARTRNNTSEQRAMDEVKDQKSHKAVKAVTAFLKHTITEPNPTQHTINIQGGSHP
jgi:Holliday junction resolvase-like predicted endonuclease